MLYQDSVHVPVPFAVVRDRLRDTHDAWFERAAQSAIEQGEDTSRIADPTVAASGPPARVHVATGRPYAGRSVYAIPLEWRIDGSEGTWSVRGQLEALSVGAAAETEIGLMMRWDDADRDAARRCGAADIVRAFLACVSVACGAFDHETGQDRTEAALTAFGGHRFGRRRHPRWTFLPSGLVPLPTPSVPAVQRMA